MPPVRLLAMEQKKMVSLGDLLIEAGLDKGRLDECRTLAATTGESLDQVVLTKDYLAEDLVLQVYAKHLGYEFREVLEGTKVPTNFALVTFLKFPQVRAETLTKVLVQPMMGDHDAYIG
jgi:hypothetical protein